MTDTLGDTKNADANSLDQLAFRQANDFLGCSVDWQPHSKGGTTNRLYCGNAKNKHYILRVNATPAYAFGVCRQREAEILQRISPYDWAPQILHNNWQQGWCLSLNQGKDSSLIGHDRRLKPSIHAAMSQWQSASLIQRSGASSITDSPHIYSARATINYATLATQYKQFFEHHKQHSFGKSRAGELIDHFKRLVDELPAVPACLTHHDLHPGNICVQESEYTIIDWEYAGIGNPWFDAAALRTEWDYSDEDILTLPALMHLGHKKLQLGLNLAIKASQIVNRLWYEVRYLSKLNNRDGSDI